MSNETYDKLYQQHEHLIDITIRKNFNNPKFLELHGITRDEIKQSGRIGLHKACETYDESKGSSFKTYAIDLIKWTISDEGKRDSLGRSTKWTFELANKVSFDKDLDHSDEVIINLYDIVGEEDQGFSEIEEDDHINFLLKRIEKKTSERVWQIVQLKLEGYTNEQAADVLGVTHQNVSALLRKYKGQITELIVA